MLYFASLSFQMQPSSTTPSSLHWSFPLYEGLKKRVIKNPINSLRLWEDIESILLLKSTKLTALDSVLNFLAWTNELSNVKMCSKTAVHEEPYI